MMIVSRSIFNPITVALTGCRESGSEWTVKQELEVRNMLDKNDNHILGFNIWDAHDIDRIEDVVVNILQISWFISGTSC